MEMEFRKVRDLTEPFHRQRFVEMRVNEIQDATESQA